MAGLTSILDGMLFTTERVDANPTMANQIEAMSHWRCRLALDQYAIEFPISMDADAMPTAEFAIGALMADIHGVQTAPSFEAWLLGLGITIDGDDRGAYETTHGAIQSHADAIMAAFGRPWLDSAITIAMMDGDMAPSISPAV